MARPKKYPDELMDRGVRLVFESRRPVAQVAADLGVGAEALRKRVRRAEADSGKRPDLLSTQEREEIRKLRKENYEGASAADADGLLVRAIPVGEQQRGQRASVGD